MTTTRQVLEQLEAERDRQRDKGWTDEHDDRHGVGHLVTLAARYGEEAKPRDFGGDFDREKLVQAASLLVAAIETLDRKPATPVWDGDVMVLGGLEVGWRRSVPAPAKVVAVLDEHGDRWVCHGRRDQWRHSVGWLTWQELLTAHGPVTLAPDGRLP